MNDIELRVWLAALSVVSGRYGGEGQHNVTTPFPQRPEEDEAFRGSLAGLAHAVDPEWDLKTMGPRAVFSMNRKVYEDIAGDMGMTFEACVQGMGGKMSLQCFFRDEFRRKAFVELCRRVAQEGPKEVLLGHTL